MPHMVSGYDETIVQHHLTEIRSEDAEAMAENNAEPEEYKAKAVG